MFSMSVISVEFFINAKEIFSLRETKVYSCYNWWKNVSNVWCHHFKVWVLAYFLEFDRNRYDASTKPQLGKYVQKCELRLFYFWNVRAKLSTTKNKCKQIHLQPWDLHFPYYFWETSVSLSKKIRPSPKYFSKIFQ